MTGDSEWNVDGVMRVIAHPKGIAGPTVELEGLGWNVFMNAQELAALLAALCAAELAVFVKVK